MPAILVLALCMLIFSIDYNIVYVALPEIGEQIGFSPQSLQWVVSGYAVGLGGFLLLGGRAVDRFGARRMLIVALALYAGSSLAGGLATDPGLLVAARIVQGGGGALLFPATSSLITKTFAEGAQRTKAFAWWGTAGASGAIAGSMAGGLLTGWLGWESVFFVNIPLCLVAVIATMTIFTPDPGTPGQSFDLPGGILATAGSTALIFALITGPEAGWGAARTMMAILIGVIGLAGFAVWERVARQPLAPPSLLRVRGLVVAMAVIFVFQGAINGLHYVFFVHLQNVLGYTPLEAGLAFIPMSVLAMLGANRLLPLLVGRFGVRWVLFGGMAGVGAAMVTLSATLASTAGYWSLLPAIVLWGLSAGTLYPAMFLAAGSGVDGGQQGVASALTQTSAQLGGAMGLAAIVAVANAQSNPSATLAGGIAAAAGACLAFAIPLSRSVHRDRRAAESASA